MPTLTVGLVSAPVKENDFQYNLEKTAEVLSRHASEGIDLFVFGEASLTGLDTTDFDSRTFPATSSVLQAISQITEEYHTSVCVGFIEQEAEKFYLTHVVSSEGAICGMQRKVLFGNPTKPHVYSSGKRVKSVIFRGYKVVLLACADWLLPEPMMQAGLHDPDLVIAPTEQRFWGPVNWSVHTKAGQAVSFWLQTPLVAAFNSEIRTESSEADVYACLAYDHNGDELIKRSKKGRETTIDKVTIELQQGCKIWGGFGARSDYLS